MQARRSDQLVPDVISCAADRGDLRVLAECVVDLPVAGDDLALDCFELDQIVTGECIHAGNEIGEIVSDQKVDAVLLESFDRAGRLAADRTLRNHSPAFPRQVRVLLRA